MHEYLKDRRDAALKLIPLLDKYRYGQGVVLAVPRGGVPIASHIAKHLNLPMELLMTKKIGHPANAEFAIGAVSIEGHILEEYPDVPAAYIDREIRTISTSLKKRYKKWVGNHQPVDLKNKVAIIIDDGMATGNTILAAVKMLRQQEPEKIIVAVPVSPVKAVNRVKKQADEMICLYTPDPFAGVGLYYSSFKQVSDADVTRLLKAVNHPEAAA